jgi:FkbM family methyltransferase
MRALLKPISPMLPDHMINRIPFVGAFCLHVPDSDKSLKIISDGKDSIASGLYWNGLDSFEPETLELYFHLLKYSRVVFDVGANTGLFALLAAVDSRDREVYAFEPVPEIFSYLQRNAQVNHLHNLTPACSAVTSYDGDIELYIPRSVTIPFSASALKGFRKASKTVTVPAVRLDTYVVANNIKRVDLLKIDTEGTEPEVLAGAKQVLARDEPIIICEVLKGRTEAALHSIFDHTPYRFFLVTNEGLLEKETIAGDESYKNRNYLFITKDKISSLLPEMIIG